MFSIRAFCTANDSFILKYDVVVVVVVGDDDEEVEEEEEASSETEVVVVVVVLILDFDLCIQENAFLKLIQ